MWEFIFTGTFEADAFRNWIKEVRPDICVGYGIVDRIVQVRIDLTSVFEADFAPRRLISGFLRRYGLNMDSVPVKFYPSEKKVYIECDKPFSNPIWRSPLRR